MRKAAARFARRHERSLTAAATVLIVVLLFGLYHLVYPEPHPFSQWDIDNAVKYTLDNTPPGAAETAVAAAIVAPSVVRVDGYLSPEHAAQLAKLEKEEGREGQILPPRPAKPDKNMSGGDKPGQPAQTRMPANRGLIRPNPARTANRIPIPPVPAW